MKSRSELLPGVGQAPVTCPRYTGPGLLPACWMVRPTHRPASHSLPGVPHSRGVGSRGQLSSPVRAVLAYRMHCLFPEGPAPRPTVGVRRDPSEIRQELLLGAHCGLRGWCRSCHGVKPHVPWLVTRPSSAWGSPDAVAVVRNLRRRPVSWPRWTAWARVAPECQGCSGDWRAGQPVSCFRRKMGREA